MFKHLLLPLDESASSLRNVRRAIGLARLFAARVTVLAITQPYSAIKDPAALGIDSEFDYLLEVSARLAPRMSLLQTDAASAGVRLGVMQVLPEDSTREVRTQALALGCDLIVLSADPGAPTSSLREPTDGADGAIAVLQWPEAAPS